MAIFPEGTGHFQQESLVSRAHYEVHGDQEQSPAAQPSGTAPFSFRRPTSSSSSPSPSPSYIPPRLGMYARAFQRSVHFADVVDNRLTTSRTIVIRFTEAEATVEGIAAKVKDALGTEDTVVLTDSQGNEISDSEGTRTIHYWKQNSRKIFALMDEDFQEFKSGRRSRTSRRVEDSSTVQQALDQIRELTDNMSQLSEVVKATTSAALTSAGLQPAKEGLSCLVCKDIMERPVFATCCGSLVGCWTCVEQWLVNSEHCLKCRAEEFRFNIHEAKGLSAVLLLFKSA